MGGIDYLRLDKTKDKSYAFDYAFNEHAAQQQVFEATTKPLIKTMAKGCNCCCFAYGATGSGKTFTMMGTADLPGVIPLTAEALFVHIKALEEEVAVTVRLSYVEIYNEQIKDLLTSESNQRARHLDVRESPGKGTFVAGASSRLVTSRGELLQALHKGNLYRTTEATNCNDVSSRSHAVLQLQLEGLRRFDGSGKATVGKFSLIDLAGSERATKTGNAGKRLTEGANINRSLLALANCINALADCTKKQQHVPFRDSKLTRLLKDSLGGHSKTVMITNVSPAADQFDETLNSLKYANRAKNIQTKEVVVRQQAAPASLDAKAIVAEISSIREEIRQSTMSMSPVLSPPPAGLAQLRQKRARAKTTAHTQQGGASEERLTEQTPPLVHGDSVESIKGISKGKSRLRWSRKEAGNFASDSEKSPDNTHSELVERWRSTANDLSFVQAHAVLDELEHGAIREMQIDFASLLADRAQLLESRSSEALERWSWTLKEVASGQQKASAYGTSALVEKQQLEDALLANLREVREVQRTLKKSMPSSERGELTTALTEITMLRAMVQGLSQSLGQLGGQLSELSAAMQQSEWPSQQTPLLVATMAAEASRLSEEATRGDLGRNSEEGCGGSIYASVAQLVPVLHHRHPNARGLFAAVRKLSTRHRSEREALCEQLEMVGLPHEAHDDGGGGSGRAGEQRESHANHRRTSFITKSSKLINGLLKRKPSHQTPRRGRTTPRGAVHV